MKPEMLLPIGLPASGKTTFAKDWLAEDPDGRVRVNYDNLRIAMYGPDWIWNRKDEEAMKAHAREIVTKALMARLSVVIDNTNLSSKVRAGWQDLARDLGAEYIEQDFDTPLEECIRRDRARTGKARVGQAVIDRMAIEYGYLDWWDAGSVMRGTFGTVDPRPKPICLVDIDGTVADCTHRMGHIKPQGPHNIDCTFANATSPPYINLNGKCTQCGAKLRKDWNAFFAEVGQDRIIKHMANLLAKLEDHLLVFVSGRPISSGRTPVGIITEDWLIEHLRLPDRLFLKQTGDHRPAVEFKREVLDHLPKERVAYVFDDSPECIRMYKSELPSACVLQPAT